MPQRFFQGQRILCRGHEWQVLRADKTKLAGGQYIWSVSAMGLNGIVQGTECLFLSDLDTIEAIEPHDIEPCLDTSGYARKAKLYWEACLRRLLPRNGALYIGQHGACQSYDYQYEPAAQALNLMRPRILIGDAVGLGKTIECGILLTELMRRGKGRRILCAVPKAILEQFQNEMWGRFAIPFHRLDSKGLERLRQDLPSSMNPFYHYDKAIISIDTLKLKKYQKLLEGCHWDVLVIDECHNVADRTDGLGGSARHRLANRLAQQSKSVILMSATPHDGTKPGFASLIKILDRTRIDNDEDYKADDFKMHFIRRTRLDVKDQISGNRRRQEQVHKIDLTAEEVELLQKIHDGDQRTPLLSKRNRMGRELFKTTLIKSFLSSPEALLATVKNKIAAVEKSKATPNQDSESFAQFLRDIKEDCKHLKVKSRMDFLRSYIDQNQPSKDNRLVIFTERLATMEAIAQMLLDDGIADSTFDPKNPKDKPKGKDAFMLATAKGSDSDADLQAIVKAFQAKSSKLHILVATNVASEGLNLHQNCYRMVHFDLPWSLITLEQRNGRIDRLGQKKTPQIHYLASIVPDALKDPNDRDLKDDFWIVNKVERRISTAAEDMAEEVTFRFSSAAEEETTYTEKYENQAIDRVDDDINPLDALFADMAAEPAEDESEDAKYERKPLPTLFEKSPLDFVKWVCKEAPNDQIKVVEDSDTEVTVSISRTVGHEISQWPKEFRGPDKKLNLESDPRKMEKYYGDRMAENEYIDMSFMNEVHPFIALLENTAMGFFPGKQVPTVALKAGDQPETVYFLLQSTLFNHCNDIVMQYWQVLEHRKGAHSLVPLIEDVTDNGHAAEVAEWLSSKLTKMKKLSELSNSLDRRISSLTEKSIDQMQEITSEARKQRAQELRKLLLAEKKRIVAWEKEREAYLDSHIALSDKAKHQGVFALRNKAKLEREKLGRDSANYSKFINDYLSTESTPDIRILGIMIEEA